MRKAVIAGLAWLAALCPASDARADAVVTVCGKDVWPGDPRTDLFEALSAGGKITFACSGRIKFTRSHALTRNTEIDGASRITLDGDGHRMFGMGSSGARIVFSRIRLEDGGIPPGGIPGSVIVGEGYVTFRDGTSITRSDRPVWILAGGLNLDKATVEHNQGPVLIISEGQLAITGGRFNDNAGILLDSARTTASIRNAQFLRNGPLRFGGAACTVTITGSRFIHHRSPGDGGALWSQCPTTIEDSWFEHNQAKMTGGALFLGGPTSLRKVRFIDNRADRGGAVGGHWDLQQPEHRLTVRHSRFEDNRAALAGGALYAGEAAGLEIAGTAFIANRSAKAGGAIYARQSRLNVHGSLFRGNDAQSGGAIQTYCMPAMGRIANSIIAGNTATGLGGAFYGGNVRFLNATLTDNGDVPIRHGVACFGTSLIAFANSILEGGWNGACGPSDASRQYIDQGHNLQFPWSTCGSSISVSYPFLGPFYAPLRPVSPADRAGDNALCRAAPISGRDFFGTHRPQGGVCSIGAVEGDLTRLIRRWLKRRTG